jgi:hypothetical protein
VRWLRGALVVTALVVAACGDDKTQPVPSAHPDLAKKLCAALLADKHQGLGERALLPPELKDDWDKWHVNNDPDQTHIRRLNEYTIKSCGFSWDNPVAPTTVAPPTTAQ